MTVSRKDVEHIAMLARLGLTEIELDRFAEQLDLILDHAGAIGKLDLSDVAPTAHAVPLRNVIREDAERPCLSQEAALANAPEQEDGYFLIPKIV